MNGKRVGATIMAILVVAGIVFWLSLPPYGKISPHGYELTTALYSACNQQDPERVAAVAELTDRAVRANKLNPTESEWLSEIIEHAQAGRWQRAATDSRELMEAQVEW